MPFRLRSMLRTKRREWRRLTLRIVAAASARAFPQAPDQPDAAQGPHAAASTGEHRSEGHGESWTVVLSRLANFAILVGGLWYFLRSPLGRHLEERSTAIRAGLENATELKRRSATQIGDIETRMRTLPHELDALRARGAEEIKSEEARIRRAAEDARKRLLEQMRRQIDLQLQAAQRDLRRETAELAVGVAGRRVASVINNDDQRHLIGRYISQVQGVS
jgi:F-type H+-transporting ATPase subunit b